MSVPGRFGDEGVFGQSPRRVLQQVDQVVEVLRRLLRVQHREDQLVRLRTVRECRHRRRVRVERACVDTRELTTHVQNQVVLFRHQLELLLVQNLKGGGQLPDKEGNGEQMRGMVPGLGSVSGCPHSPNLSAEVRRSSSA